MATTLGKRSLATAESVSTVVPAIFSSSSSASSSSVTSTPSNTDFTAYVSPADLHPVAPFFKPPQQCDKKCKTESLSDEEKLKHDREVADISEVMRQGRLRKQQCCGLWDNLSEEECIVPLYSRCSYGGVHEEVQSSVRPHLLASTRSRVLCSSFFVCVGGRELFQVWNGVGARRAARGPRSHSL